jgi:ribose-phosphate pyrophosphokinase
MAEKVWLMEPLGLFSGTANPILAGEVAHKLGVCLGGCNVVRYPDGEVAVQLLDPVRPQDVFVVQPTAPPVDEHLIERLALVDASRRAAAAHITMGRAILRLRRHGRRRHTYAERISRSP